MFSTSAATIPVLIVGFLIGATALGLIANELGKRSGLPVVARFGLGGALGMGVLAVGIKLLIVTTLSQTGGQAMVEVGTATRTAVDSWFPDAAEDPDLMRVSSAPLGARTWRVLPEKPRDARGNVSTPEKVALGRSLFFDTNLSVDRTMSCASCHVLKDGGDDNAQYSTGFRGQQGDRNAPTVLNAAFLSRFFWDGRAVSLERQAEGPFVNPVEMAMPSLDSVVARVQENSDYKTVFADVFPGREPINIRNITRAIAAFERTLITPDTPYDRFVRGDNSAMSKSAVRGMALFDQVGCRSCHIDPVFSAAGTVKPLGTFRNFPVYQANNPFLGKYDLLVDGAPRRFRVPSLRNVALTAPYFHNGSVTDLEEAVRIMAVSQLGRRLSDDPLADVRISSAVVEGDAPGRNLHMFKDRALSRAEISDIAEFLRALTAYTLPN